MDEQIIPFEPRHYAAAIELWERTPGVGLSDADEPQAIAQFLSRNPGMSVVAVTNGSLGGTLLLIIDNLGLKPLRPPANEDLHDLIAEHYETAATIVTSNLDFTEWDQAFPANRLLASATLDRLRHNAYCLVLDGDSYRAPKLPPTTPKSRVANPSKTTHS